MAFRVYILQSESSGRHYCGYSGDVERRLREHNDPAYTLTRTTKRFKGPWRLVWVSQELERNAAVALEKKVKNRGIARFLHDQSGEDSLSR